MLPIILRKVVSNYLPSSRTMRECYVLHSFVNTGHCTLQWIPILIQGKSQSPCHGLQDPAWSLISLLLFVHDLISLWPHWAEGHSDITDFALIHSAWNAFPIRYLIPITPLLPSGIYANVSILVELLWAFCLGLNTPSLQHCKAFITITHTIEFIHLSRLSAGWLFLSEREFH